MLSCAGLFVPLTYPLTAEFGGWFASWETALWSLLILGWFAEYRLKRVMENSAWRNFSLKWQRCALWLTCQELHTADGGIAVILKIWRSDNHHYLWMIPAKVIGFLLRGNSAVFHLEGYQKLGNHFPGPHFLSWESLGSQLSAGWHRVPLGLRIAPVLSEEGKVQVKDIIVSKTTVKFWGFNILDIVAFFTGGIKNLSSLAQQCSKHVPLGDGRTCPREHP